MLLGVPFISAGLETTWTIFVRAECSLIPGTADVGIVGLDNWQVGYGGSGIK